MSTLEINIPCKHLTEGISKDEVVPNYFPLKLEEINSLLMMAKNIIMENGDESCISLIIGRLCQGIKGITCPANGPLASKKEKINEMCIVSLDDIDTLDVEKLSQKIYDIMEN